MVSIFAYQTEHWDVFMNLLRLRPNDLVLLEPAPLTITWTIFILGMIMRRFPSFLMFALSSYTITSRFLF